MVLRLVWGVGGHSPTSIMKDTLGADGWRPLPTPYSELLLFGARNHLGEVLMDARVTGQLGME
jgi:hypothetical protein